MATTTAKKATTKTTTPRSRAKGATTKGKAVTAPATDVESVDVDETEGPTADENGNVTTFFVELDEYEGSKAFAKFGKSRDDDAGIFGTLYVPPGTKRIVVKVIGD